MTAGNPFDVRRAVQGDEERVFTFLRGLHAENGMVPMSDDKVMGMINRGTHQAPPGVMIGLIEGDKGIEASIGLVLSQWWYADRWHLEELWNYVGPPYRKSTHCKRLIGFAKWCAEQLTENGKEPIPLLMGIITKQDLEQKMRLYQRQMPQIGALFGYGTPVQGLYKQRRLAS